MAISLLYPDGIAPTAVLPDEGLLSHLSLEGAFGVICPDVKRRGYFMRVLSELNTDRRVIEYRQRILMDFRGNPTLLPRLTALSERFDALRSTAKQAAREDFRLTIDDSRSPDAAKNLLAARALDCKRALLFVKAFAELLSCGTIQSEGLLSLRKACAEIADGADFPKLLALCAKYENGGIHGFTDCKITLGEDGRIADCQLIDHRHIHITDPDQKRKAFPPFRRQKEPEQPCERLNPAKGDSYDTLICAATASLTGLFASMAEQLFERFAPFCRGLTFYETACRYMDALADRGLPCCFPTFPADGGVHIRGLYDLTLAMSTPGNVVPNDLRLEPEQRGILLFGDNSSGKTVFLRSVGCAQLLAQAGLPVAAKEARLTFHTGMASQFAENEKAGVDAGRFEQEVRDLASMVDSLRAGSLVFLNETFQSTAYDEGAEGLYELLRYFSDCGIRWMLVSHLRALEEKFDRREALILHTGTGFRVSEVSEMLP
ncbi:MAG: hypothetical protein IJ493_06965 [Clostridia bacterium]|nr:hypothetical protein [Clostridia bacterium]